MKNVKFSLFIGLMLALNTFVFGQRQRPDIEWITDRGQIFEAGKSITIAAKITDDGRDLDVTFKYRLSSSDTYIPLAAPTKNGDNYQITLSEGLSTGEYRFMVKAVDDDNNRKRAVLSIVVSGDDKPQGDDPKDDDPKDDVSSINFVAPDSAQSFNTSDEIELRLKASGDDFASVRVGLIYAADQGVRAWYTPKNLGGGDYSLTLQPLTAGIYTIIAEATDSVDNVKTSSVTITVNPTDNGSLNFYEWANLPTWASPGTIGTLLSDNLVNRDYTKFGKTLHYSEYNTGHAAFRFAKTTGDSSLVNQLIGRYQRLNNDNDEFIYQARHGRAMTSLILFEEFRATDNDWYYNKGLDRAEDYWHTRNQWDEDDILERRRLWADDFYLSSLLDSDYYRLSADPKAIERMTRWLSVHIDVLQTTSGARQGLIRHTKNYTFYWGRGCGWAALGLTEALRAIPEDHPGRDKVMNGYLDLMAALKRYQHNDGLWHQLIDDPDSWLETSGSALFAYAYIVGIDNGWLDINEYGPVAKKAWLALVNKIDDQGNLADVCVGTNEGDDASHYLGRRRANGDMHGQAPVIWSAEAMLRSVTE